MTTNYPADTLGEYQEDDGTMPENVAALSEVVVGHRIVSVEKGAQVRRRVDEDAYYWNGNTGTVITLDNGVRVGLIDTTDCCAYTDLEAFLLNADKVDHIITGVASTDGYTKWHIFADMGDVLELTVGWSCGNAFYYGYGFEIVVEDAG